jgi:hypothetical protein
VLLNSDTEPAGDWLDRLRAHALQSSNVATVTPFSNNAALASYPQMSEYNPLPSDLTVQQLDELFRTVNSGTSIPLAAGHGSAMYMTRACLDDVGFFDHVVFGPGYGEEADFCARASRRGWTNLLACDVFVKHVGAVSFGSDRQTLRRAGLERFIAIHPDDPGIRAAYRADDPPREYRLNVDIARVNASSRRIVLLVNGHEDLASAMYRDNLVRALKEQVEFVLLGADPERPRRLVLTRLPSGERLNADVHRYDEERLVEVVERIHIDRVHYQDVHRDDHVLEVAERLAVPYDVSVHDFRRISLLPDRTRPFIEGAARVFVPNIFAAERVLRHYPDASVLVVPLEQLEGPADEPSTAPTVIEDETLRILTIGSLRAAQGADILEAAAIDARRRDLPLEFHLLGSAVPPLAAFPGSNLHIYEPRGERDLIQSIHRVDPHLCWFPWREPEVGSVDLGAALHAGLPVIASDLGDVRERLAGRRHSWAVDPQIPAERWNDLFIRLRSGDQLKEHAVPAERRNQDVSDFRYTLDYIGSAADLAVTVDRR